MSGIFVKIKVHYAQRYLKCVQNLDGCPLYYACYVGKQAAEWAKPSSTVEVQNVSNENLMIDCYSVRQ